MPNWLFQWPEADGSWPGVCQALEAELAGHPDAAAIPDDEAEQFAAVAWGLMKTGVESLEVFCRALGVQAVRGSEKSRRRTVILLLRTWPDEKRRGLLVQLPRFLALGSIPELLQRTDRVTVDMLRKAWVDRMSLAWITQILRLLGATEQIPAFLDTLDGALIERRVWVASGKLMMKRVVWQGAAEAQAQAVRLGQQQRMLSSRFRQQESLLRSLAVDVADVAARRDAFRQQAKNAQAGAHALVAQARAEVAAAEAELKQRQAEQAQDLAQLSAGFGARLHELAQQLADLRHEQAGALHERGRSGVGPLGGITFQVTGPEGDSARCRALIESAGGRVVREGARVTIVLGADVEGRFTTTGTGLGALERVIRTQVLPQLLELRAGRM